MVNGATKNWLRSSPERGKKRFVEISIFGPDDESSGKYVSVAIPRKNIGARHCCIAF